MGIKGEEPYDMQHPKEKKKKSPIFYILLICFILGVIFQREEIVIGAREWGLFLFNLASDSVNDASRYYFGGEEKKDYARWIDSEMGDEEPPRKLAYESLDEECKDAYEQIYVGIMNHDERIHMHSKNVDVIEKAFQAVMADNGGLFWVFGYRYRSMGIAGNTVAITVEPGYTMNVDQRAAYQKKIDEAVIDMLSGLPADADDYEKSKYVYETLITRVEYDKNSSNNQNIISVFINHATVCQGYSDAVAYLLQRLGVPCMIVTGNAGNEPHAWNILEIDKEFYNLDVTWGNNRFRDMNANEKKRIDHAYLNITTEEISVNHTIDMKIDVPLCTGTKANYYRKIKHYFDKFDNEKIGKVIAKDYRKHKKETSLRFANKALLKKTLKYFIDDGKLYLYCPGLSHISYLVNEETNILTIQY